MTKSIALALAATGLLLGAWAEEEQTDDGERFGPWRVGVGAAFNGRVKSRLHARNLPQPGGYAVPAASSQAAAWARARARQYDGGGYIASDDANAFDTENWKLPVSSYQGDGSYVLDNAYEEVVGTSTSSSYHDRSDDEMQYGISLELSREIWVYDENAEHRWGVDFAAGISYFFEREIYRARGSVTRTDMVRDGVVRTDVSDADTMYDYDNGLDSPVGGFYGYGNATRSHIAPALGWAGVGDPYDAGGATRPVTSSTEYRAHGDYQELEMLFLIRPWYEITPWWRVFVQGGVGVSWGRFDSTFIAANGSGDEDFDQWDCYGAAGLGTAFRYGSFDIGIDVIGRFLRDDLDVHGRHVHGSIDRADWGLRLMLGYSF